MTETSVWKIRADLWARRLRSVSYSTASLIGVLLIASIWSIVTLHDTATSVLFALLAIPIAVTLIPCLCEIFCRAAVITHTPNSETDHSRVALIALLAVVAWATMIQTLLTVMDSTPAGGLTVPSLFAGVVLTAATGFLGFKAGFRTHTHQPTSKERRAQHLPST